MQMMDWGEYQPVIQEAKAPHSLPANRALQKYRPPEVGNAEQICNADCSVQYQARNSNDGRLKVGI